MKIHSAFAIASSILAVLFSELAAAGEPAPNSIAKEGASIDCSKETWPDFSAACLSNSRPIEVRKVSMNRRY